MHEHVVVEYTDDKALTSLKPQLLYTFKSSEGEGIRYHLSALTDVYAPDVSSVTAKSYLEELQAVAQATGKTLEELLAEELSKIKAAARIATPTVGENPISYTSQEVKSPPSFGINEVNPPEIQRVVVEHIVRNTEVSSQGHASSRLRSFSGKCPHPNSKVDYDTWRSNVEFILRDPSYIRSTPIKENT